MRMIWMVLGLAIALSTAVTPALAAPAPTARTADSPTVSVIKVRSVQTGFTFTDELGRRFKLIAVKPYKIDTPAEQASYDSSMKTILTAWLTAGETVSVLADMKKDRDGLIPALVYVGDALGCSLEYVWRELALIDERVPDWFNMRLFLNDAMNPPARITGRAAANPEDEGAFSLYVMHGGRVLYSGYVYPASEED